MAHAKKSLLINFLDDLFHLLQLLHTTITNKMSITDASKATTAAPAVDQPVAETAKNVEEKTTVEETSKEADNVSTQKKL